MMNMQSVPSFCCMGEVRPNDTELHEASYIKNGELERLTSMDFNSIEFSKDHLTFFGHNFATRSAWITNVNNLFLLARQKIHLLEQALNNGIDCANDLSSEFTVVRSEILYFLSYIKYVVAKYTYTAATHKYLINVVNNLKDLMSFFGCINELPTYLFATMMEHGSNANVGHLYFHLCLDVRWMMIEILYMIKQKNIMFSFEGLNHSSMNEEDTIADDAFSTYVHSVLSDLVQLAYRRHSKLQLFEYKIIPPFHCTCIREFWLLLRLLLDHDQKLTGANSFWITFTSVVHPYLHENSKADNTNLKKETIVGFVWWLFSHLVALYNFDLNGVYSLKQINNPQRNNHMLLQNLVTATFDTEKLEERVARCYLQCCYNICSQWDPSCEFLSSLWNYFFKNLNSTFTHATSLEGLQSISASAKDLLTNVKERAFNERIDAMENSFQMFLRLLSFQLRLSFATNQIQNWKQFKGRIFVKFHKRKMTDLNDAGLNNFIHLFLTLACIGEFEDVAVKAFDLVEMKITLFSQQLIVWCGQFAFLHLCIEKNLDLKFLASKLVSSFSTVAQCFKKKADMSTIEHHELMKLLILYIKETQQLIDDSTDLKLSECTLLGADFKSFLDHCDIDEIQSTLTLFLSVMTKIRFLYRCGLQTDEDGLTLSAIPTKFVQNTDLKVFWKVVYPYVKVACSAHSSPPCLPNIAAGLTILLHDFPQVHKEESVPMLFSFFGLNSNIPLNFVSHYLCHMLTQEAIMKELLENQPDISSKIIRSWIACSVFLPTVDQQVQELSRLVSKLPEVEAVLSSIDLNDDENVENSMIVNFFKALVTLYNRIQGFSERSVFRQSRGIYFADIGKLIESTINFNLQYDVLKDIYIVVGNLVKFCSPICYARSKPTGLLHSIVNRMLLPRCMYLEDKPLPNTFIYAYRDTLDLFIDGLMQLSSSQDLCINNFLKDITIQSILRFPVKSKTSVAEHHPLIKIVYSQLSDSEPISSDSYLRYLLRVIQENYLMKKPSNPQHQLTIIFFLVEMMQLSSESMKRQMIELLLLSVLSCCLDIDVKLNKELILKCLKLMIQSCIKDSNTKESPCINILIQFVQKQISKNPAGMFKLFEGIARIHAPFVKEIVPAVAREINQIEEKRGVGKDTFLRQNYRTLLDKLM